MRIFTLAALALATACLCSPLSAGETAAAKYKTTFYGQIKNDIIYDSHGTDSNEYSDYVVSEKASERDFRINSKGTRFGLDITDGDRVTAKVEADFFGDDTAGAGMRLRHAYVEMKAGSISILSGQTWQLTPLELSGTNNEFSLGYSGALWMRAPQLRVTYKSSDALSAAVAAVRPTRKLTDNEGTASGLPQAQAQVQYKAGKARFTLMGAYGKWRNTATGRTGEVQLADFGYNIPLGGVFALNGQLWTGRNLYDFLGGIGQNGYGPDVVKASGGFANLSIKPAGRFSYNLAYGVDNPENGGLAAGPTAKTRNSTMLANASCLAYEKVTVSLEVWRQVTEYKLAAGYSDFDNMHYQFSFKFPF